MTSAQPGPGFGSALLVVALHQQRPELDGVACPTVVDEIRRHGLELRQPLGETDPDEVDGLPLYAPQVIALAGSYDFATLYLADDMSSVDELAAQHGILAQDYLFGPLSADLAETERSALRRLLSPGTDDAMALVAMCSLKLADHFLAATGNALRQAVRRHVLAEAPDGLDLVVLHCWSWPEVVVLAVSDQLEPITQLVDRVERLRIQDLVRSDPVFGFVLGRREAVGAPQRTALGNPIPRTILRMWACGRRTHDADESGPGGSVAVEHWRLVAELATRDAAVVMRCQLGFTDGQATPGSAWDALSSAIQNEREHSRGRDGMAGWQHRPPADQPATVPLATIRIQPKPGHLQDVEQLIRRVDELWPKAWSATRSLDGHQTAVHLVLRGEPSTTELASVLATSLWLRWVDRHDRHLLDTSTSFHLPRTETADAHGPVEPAIEGGPRGYALLDPQRYRQREAWYWERARTGRLGTTTTRSVRNWTASIRSAASRPDMYGAMLDLLELRRVILYRLGQPALPWPGAVGDLLHWLEHGEQAYHQRIQFSPAMLGGPRLQGRLPFGINQLVTMVAGLGRAIFGLAGAGPERPAQQLPPAILVVLTADDAIEVNTHPDVITVHMGAMSAVTPPLLAVLMHELGHVIVQREMLYDTDPARRTVLYEGWKQARRDLVASYEQLERHSLAEPESDAVIRLQHWERAESFISDILAHACWRRLGCEGATPEERYEQFRDHHLTASALGVRTDNRRETRDQAEEAWLEVLVHLLLQRELQRSGEDIVTALDRVTGILEDQQALQAFLREQQEYFGAELSQASPGAPEHTPLQPDLRSLGAGRFAYWGLLGTLRLCWVTPPDVDATLRPETRTLVRLTVRAVFDRFAELERGLQQAQDELEADRAWRLLPGQLAAGRPGVSPPWSVVDPQGGEPTMQAFVWARHILSAATRQILHGLPRESNSRAVYRDARNRPVGTEPSATLHTPRFRPGVYTDHRGRFFLVGRESRARYLKVQAASLSALTDLALRVRAGPLRWFLQRRREFPRWLARRDTVAWLEHDGDAAPYRLLDSTPTGLRCEGTLLQGTRVHVHCALQQGLRIPATVQWQARVGARECFGLSLDGIDLREGPGPLLTRPHWAAHPQTGAVS